MNKVTENTKVARAKPLGTDLTKKESAVIGIILANSPTKGEGFDLYSHM